MKNLLPKTHLCTVNYFKKTRQFCKLSSSISKYYITSKANICLETGSHKNGSSRYLQA